MLAAHIHFADRYLGCRIRIVVEGPHATMQRSQQPAHLREILVCPTDPRTNGGKEEVGHVVVDVPQVRKAGLLGDLVERHQLNGSIERSRLQSLPALRMGAGDDELEVFRLVQSVSRHHSFHQMARPFL